MYKDLRALRAQHDLIELVPSAHHTGLKTLALSLEPSWKEEADCMRLSSDLLMCTIAMCIPAPINKDLLKRTYHDREPERSLWARPLECKAGEKSGEGD